MGLDQSQNVPRPCIPNGYSGINKYIIIYDITYRYSEFLKNQVLISLKETEIQDKI